MQCYRQLQLHVFVDASEAAYAAVAYFRIVDTNGTSKCALVTAKTKVAPLKHLSIPRMELQAAVLGPRLMRFILESHTVTITERYMWSDSTTVLAWLRADPRKYKQYVACRIGEILEQTDVNEWWWVPSKNNPADYATKWGSGPSVDVKGAWFQGPSFLYLPMEGWPKQKVPLPMVEEEFRPCKVHVEAAVPTAVIDCERFSKWERLLRATAYVHRYVGNLKRSIYGEAKNTGFLNQEELQQAEVTLIAMAQRQEFSDELAVLSRDRDRPRTDRVGLSKASSLYQLTPFVDETVVRKIGSGCNMCKQLRTTPHVPRMASLPPARLASFTRPFTYVGLDFFGPLVVKVGRSNVKRWVALFTCLTIRAVHCEVVYSLSTDACLKSIRRFVCRRGAPAEIHSDNGTNFCGAERVLVRQIQHRLAATVTSTTTKWLFIPPTASHMGGAWERMVRSVK
ncbi:uncharacterized protein LOC129765604 [Toxorhynchites rutilus septentrionalis]|uniref:uncharacterized protein LOC129765604 n=1 Tax=Toxorhynchites rutilus septentrionalis TaxID=329112 RepID=UPI00247B0A5C|nr:uncharacterized protein LOC129765604 [Toxorhynchites rutilus septentrionalis]